MELFLALLWCVVAGANAQMMGPMSGMGMGPGWGGPMWHSGVRYPGMMQTSQYNSMTYPTWRSHPLFRTSAPDKNVPSDVTNVPKVPSSQEVLTHMALAAASPKPYLDTIADFLYEPQKARTVVAPVAPKSYAEMVSDYLYEPQKARTVLTPMAGMAPMYLQGMNVMRAGANADDCVQEGTRWERGMDWLY